MSETRRYLVPLVVLVLAFFVMPTGSSADVVRLRDVAGRYDLGTDVRSWDVDTGDLTGDGRDDLVVSYHGWVAFFAVTDRGLHRRLHVGGHDPHACAISDVDLNGLGDVYCTRGARIGTIAKRNRLWMQRTSGAFADRAGAFGVTDPYGRGRHTAFFDLNGDPYPDLFVGNDFPRQDEHPSPNRTFVNVRGEGFREVRIGATGELGALCVTPGDLDGDGWEDLVVCGKERLLVYRNRAGDKAARTLRETARGLGVALPGVVSAVVDDLNLDGVPDLALLRPGELRVYGGRPAGGFGLVQRVALTAGRWVTVGDLDGRDGRDLFIVRTCDGGRNRRDLALFETGAELRYGASGQVPLADGGCGDVATTIDLNGDGLDEVVVLNGAAGEPPNGGITGPVQVLTTG